MAHNLYQDKMAYHGETPWHKLGTQFSERMTAAQAIQAAGLDYQVNKERLYRRDPQSGLYVETDSYATINGDTNQILGYVGAQYTPLQYTDAFGFFDEAIGEGQAIYETAGAIGNGEQIWLLAKLPKSFEVLYGDTVDAYFLLHNSHDGTSPVRVIMTPIRVVCQNTLNAAMLQRRFVSNVMQIRHTTKVAERVREAGKILKEMHDYYEELGDSCRKLANFTIDDEYLDSFKKKVFGDAKDLPETGRARLNLEDRLSVFQDRLEHGMGTDLEGVKGTAWWPLQAAVEMADYDVAASDLKRILSGPSFNMKKAAVDATWELVGARS